MTATSEALELSIKHWEENAAITDLDYASTSRNACALCEKFFDIYCFGCPVSSKTQVICCNDTPYSEANRAHANADLENFKIAAQKEVEFLKSLREDVK